MDHTAQELLTSYFGTQHTAGQASVRSHIEDGLQDIMEAITGPLQQNFSEAIKFHRPAVTGRMKASVEGDVGWNPDPTKKGYVMVSFGPDQFDLSKAELHLYIGLPNGKTFQKSWEEGDKWLNMPVSTIGAKYADFLMGHIDRFFLSAES
jgi:hypothetical protein